MPIYASESKQFPWKWLLAILVLAILILILFYRREIFGGRQAGSQDGDPASSSQPASAAASEGSDSPAASGISMPGPSGVAASDDWYTRVAFRGLVLNESNRAPVPGATVSVYAYASPPSTVDTMSGARGDFEVIAPPAYRYDFKVEAEGFRDYEADSLVITRPYYQLEILLTPVEMLRGRVVDNQDAGVPDAFVQLRREDDRSEPFLSTTADAKGFFSFLELPRRGRFNIEVYHPGFDSTGLVPISIPAGNEVLVRMNRARATGSITGTVTDAAAKPLPGATIELFEPSDGRLNASIQTDAQGGYRFASVREGYYLVRCSAEGFTDARINQSTVAVFNGKEAKADFSIDPGLTLRGSVVNQREEPVPGAQVTYVQVSDAERPPGRIAQRPGAQRSRLRFTTTDKNGNFQITGLPETLFQLGVSHRDYQSLTTQLRPTPQVHTLILDSGIMLRGTVSDARGLAVERFTLTLQSKSGRTDKSYSFITTDGHFEIHGLAKDTYQVLLRGGGGGMGGRGGFSGTLDLQGPAEINILLESNPGGRGQSTLNILKSK